MSHSPNMDDVITPEVLEAAYTWLVKRRQAYPSSSDVWSFRRKWQQEKARLQEELAAGRYRFSPMSRVIRRDQSKIELWSARDALVLKCLALVLSRRLPLSKRCFHIKGSGGRKRGGKAAVREVLQQLPQNRFVLKTDVQSYYASIDHNLLLDRLAEFIQDPRVLNLIRQYLKRTVECGGLFWGFEKGIALGCPLSPVMGAFFLRAVDQALGKLELFYVRFMDDIVVLAPTRWKLRGAVKAVNQTMGALRLAKHPGKTFIGRIEKGFDFLGYHFSPQGLTLARQTIENFLERAIRLYEQEPGAEMAPVRLGAYVRRWGGWARAGLRGSPMTGASIVAMAQPPWPQCNLGP